MADTGTINWVDEGEKYALVGLSIKTEGAIQDGKIAPHLWVVADRKFEFPAHWREWLGSMRAEEVENSNLLLISKIASERPEVFDDENLSLEHWGASLLFWAIACIHFFDGPQAGRADWIARGRLYRNSSAE